MNSQDILDALSTAVLVLDEDLRILEANASAQTLFGLGINQLRSHALSELLQHADSIAATLHRALLNGESCVQREVNILPLHGDATERIADIYATPLETTGLVRCLLMEIGDATQRQRINRETALLTQLGGSRLMIKQLAHEIKNPLGGLRGAAQLLERQLVDVKLHDYTKVIIGEADRLTALVDAMLGPSRSPQKEIVNVHELAEHVLNLIGSEATTGVVIERDYDPSLPELRLDRHMIVQAILNLARNALQAVGAGGRILLRTRVISHQNIGIVHHRLVASVQIEDDGPGVPDAIRDTLFYPLVTARQNGSGLGLAIAQDLIIRHGGLIEFTSVPGMTQFTILLPIEGQP